MIEIINYEKVDKDKVEAYVDFKVKITQPTTLIFRKVTRLNSNNKRWLSLPSFKRESNDNAKYLKYCEFENDKHNEKLLELLNTELKKYLENESKDEPPSWDIFDFATG